MRVNHEVLVWARNTAGLSRADVAEKMKRDSAEISRWEEGEDHPTYPQLERLARVIYHRPVAIFFFPEPPEEESVAASFRTLPASEAEMLSPTIRLLLRRAAALQENMRELSGGHHPGEGQLLADSDSAPRSGDELAEWVRGRRWGILCRTSLTVAVCRSCFGFRAPFSRPYETSLMKWQRPVK